MYSKRDARRGNEKRGAGVGMKAKNSLIEGKFSLKKKDPLFTRTMYDKIMNEIIIHFRIPKPNFRVAVSSRV